MKHAQPGSVYTLREMLTELSLRDTPNLGFTPVSVRYPETKEIRQQTVQDSHLTEEEMLALPGWAETKWRYIRETHEWIPVFVAVDNAEIEALCVIEPYTDRYFRNEGIMHVYPRGVERAQHKAYDPETHGTLVKVA
ncbi:hypothetical protein pEaSNUABM14_00270 [Erwinia phage pEa_SNUABM_14]|uniref:Uncharacterized protein n=1 Tax=Erwinia phage pEa_SNUABM_7 TaxID=2866695 RepID=A0AAE7WT54_9CAUD|nr:hypothetical protein MPK74_gp271 [Erwinia phage pEa_SNUABM_7]QYW04595.1 hypothetical protein pEaSNUABM14_00270 [Erwinia phage pEa_SNUABM_14]QYW04939.1 hypothetical protein pEaSNUABM7_00271 [Erwinia phage pEa_SNUABM_7]